MVDFKKSIQLEHVATCANKYTNCLDVGPQSVIAFAASNSVVLYQGNRHEVYTYNAHKGNVVCVKWTLFFEGGLVSKQKYLVSGSVDKSIICWKYTERENAIGTLSEICNVKAHDHVVTAVDSICYLNCDGNNIHLIASTGADSMLKLWSSLDGLKSLKCIQSIDFKNKFIFGLALWLLPQSNTPILACACDDFKVCLYTQNSDGQQFDLSVTLKGHEDWVRGVCFNRHGNDELFLASSSQDSYIRLWKITWVCDEKTEQDLELKLEKQNFVVKSDSREYNFSVIIDSVLSGHENWVYSVCWNEKNQLLSASIDKTVIIWKYEEDMWVDFVRMGEVGGNTLGFYGAQFNGDNEVIAHSFSGALHSWVKDGDNAWTPDVVLSGHNAPVCDIAWERNGRFIMSTSDDQSTRIFSKFKSDKTGGNPTWHEVARPQIHGYDMQCLALLSSTRFVSGADEKVLRVFNASKNFLDNFRALTGHDLSTGGSSVPEGATVPALGLSNKAVFASEPVTEAKSAQYIENMFISMQLSEAPPETYLLQNTLWPEITKLYGHVYEIFCVASNHDSTLIASSAKSSQPQHSGIMIWDAKTWQQISTLYGHTLTVTQIEFSPNDEYLVSVSRDRTWILHRIVKKDDDFKFELVMKSEKKSCHSRIIWSCSWAVDSTLFATASRDKKVMFWKLSTCAAQSTIVERVNSTPFSESVNAVSFYPKLFDSNHILAMGFESGKIYIHNFDASYNLTLLISLDRNMSHCLTVKRLKWNPMADNDQLVLGSCSMDNQVKIFRIVLDLD